MTAPCRRRRRFCRVVLAGAGAVLMHGAASADPSGLAVPALYTPAQAASGAGKYAANCQQCHGNRLQGRSGPALTGPHFASAKAAFKVHDVFIFLSRSMPAPQPGSLPPQDYVEIMAFLLQQNGYPAGPAPLTLAAAKNSDVPLLYHGK